MEKQCKACGQIFIASDDEAWKQTCFECWKKSKQRRVDFVDEFYGRVRALLQLCHPDKHNNSELSKQITQWLLDNKR